MRGKYYIGPAIIVLLGTLALSALARQAGPPGPPDAAPIKLRAATFTPALGAELLGYLPDFAFKARMTPAVVTPPADVTVQATGALTEVDLGTATATDLVDGSLTPTPDDTGPFPVGATTVTWSATDAAGNTGTATQTVTVIQPEITSPPPGTTLSGTTETFSWTLGDSSVEKYKLWVGTSVGSRDIASSVGLDHPQSSYTVNGLPGDGSTVYVRLRVKIDGSWKVENDYQYTACDCGGAITVDNS